jgi:hypothetical protein
VEAISHDVESSVVTERVRLGRGCNADLATEVDDCVAYHVVACMQVTGALAHVGVYSGWIQSCRFAARAGLVGEGYHADAHLNRRAELGWDHLERIGWRRGQETRRVSTTGGEHAGCDSAGAVYECHLTNEDMLERYERLILNVALHAERPASSANSGRKAA